MKNCDKVQFIIPLIPVMRRQLFPFSLENFNEELRIDNLAWATQMIDKLIFDNNPGDDENNNS